MLLSEKETLKHNVLSVQQDQVDLAEKVLELRFALEKKFSLRYIVAYYIKTY